ncbi:MAG: SufB/SufD family protein [archaeon]|nr:SufD family Fe-S cluster assembly protein [Candidatus Bathyarchaeum sp.]
MANENSLTKISPNILKDGYNVGMDLNEENRSGTLLHVDQNTIYTAINEYFKGKIEIMDTKKALEKYSWLQEYMWRLVDPNKDEFTQKVKEEFSGGYFIRILPGVEVTLPLQSCIMITKKDSEQRIHNIIIAEEGSKANIITGCIQHLADEAARHLGVSEIYVKKGATLNLTMIHNWTEKTFVRPRSATEIEDGGKFISNYICLNPVNDVQMYPVAFCNGNNSRVSFNSVLYGHKNSSLDIGSRAVLNGKGSKAELVTRAIVRRGATIFSRGKMEGNNSECKGHLECRGLVLDEESYLEAIPELLVKKGGAELTHEAAIGKISEKEIVYLMTRRLSRDEAISLTIRGFMNVDVMGLPDVISTKINKITELVAEAS